VKNASPDAVSKRFRDYFGAAADEAMAEYRQRARSDAPASLLGEAIGDSIFAGGTFAFAEKLATMGKPAHVFRFDWAAGATGASMAGAADAPADIPANASEPNPFLACHCGEIPFVFDNFASWDAPMLKGGDPAAMQRLGDAMQDAWIAFARTGNPGHSGLPSWPRWTADNNAVMLFDETSRVEDDPAGRRRWRYWP
jgi:para-nitrobenzyl esterase